MVKISKLTMLPLILVAVCVICRPANADTNIYIFDTSQSTVTQTGGFAGVNITYAVTGQFRLRVNSDLDVSSFEMVDANLADETGAVYGPSLDEIFNMTGLAGIIVDDTTIQFEGKTADGTESDVRLKLSFMKDSAHLTGNTTPPPNSADLFLYDVNAVAIIKYAGGAGEPNDPYQIATAQDLITLGETPEDYDMHFILTADIDLDPNLPGRKVFDRAVIAPDINDIESDFQGISFTGVFDGNGHTISHLTIHGQGCLGLFGKLDSGVNVKNLGVVDVNITGSGLYAGGLAGQNSGEISVCYSTGVVSAGRSVGGLVGYNSNNGLITNCASRCTVSGFENIGGLLGNNGYGINCWVIRCFSTGMVTGTEDVGGLVGDNDANIDNSLTDDNDTNIIDSFWDMETSGKARSEGGTGKTTAEMYTASTFLNASWDFVGETDNGTEDIWSICEGTNYPRFVWQIPAVDFVCPDGITIDDFMFFLEHWLDDNCDFSNGYCEGTDLDQSGKVDVFDLEIFFENWPDKN